MTFKRLVPLVLIVVAGGCSVYHQSLPDLFAPDSLTVGGTVKLDDGPHHEVKLDSIGVQLRWDLK